MEVQRRLDELIIRRIIEDSTDYLGTITEDNSDVELREFFNSLLDRRRLEVENIISNQPTHRATPLQQRETELSALEEAARVYDEELEAKQNEQKGQDIGEE